VLSHRHFDHISGFRLHVENQACGEAYLPRTLPWGRLFTHVLPDSKESLAGVPPETVIFGGKTNSIDFKPGERFHTATNAEFVPSNREIAPGVYLIVTRSVMMETSAPIHRASRAILTSQAFPSFRWR